MSDPIITPPSEGVPAGEEAGLLQFDQAEFATPASERPTCSVCQQAIPEEYYEIQQKMMCPRCRDGVEAALRGGSPIARFLKATTLGVLAAAFGAVIYYAFVRMTVRNWALIAIVVGLMVGGAVRKGTGNRGGRLYQLMAVFLTYSSIVAMNVPLLIEAFIKHPIKKPAAQVAADKGDRRAKAPLDVPEAKKASPAEPIGADAGAQQAQAAPPRLSDVLRLLAMLVGLFYAYPVLEATEAPISGLIYAFALWEAWKINKPIQLVFNGPFRLAAAGAADGGPVEVVHES